MRGPFMTVPYLVGPASENKGKSDLGGRSVLLAQRQSIRTVTEDLDTHFALPLS